VEFFRIRGYSSADQNGHDVFFAHHQQLYPIDRDGLTRVFAEQNAVAHFDFKRADLPSSRTLPVANGENLALVWFFSGGIRNDQAGSGFGSWSRR